jgi:hypothetical protein
LKYSDNSRVFDDMFFYFFKQRIGSGVAGHFQALYQYTAG